MTKKKLNSFKKRALKKSVVKGISWNLGAPSVGPGPPGNITVRRETDTSVHTGSESLLPDDPLKETTLECTSAKQE